MKSMTGYAYKEYRDESLFLSVEIKGYNSRFLEIFVYMPPVLSALEAEVREYMAARCGRGKVEISIRLKEPGSAVFVSVNTEAVRSYAAAIAKAAEVLGTGEKPGLAQILPLEGVLEIERNRDDERYRRCLEPLLRDAALQFDAEKIREGKHTADDILSHINQLESSAATVASHAPELEAAIKENLHNRFAELLGDKIDENRILAETAVLLMKYTISEELSRLSSHLAEFRAEMERNPGPGKKLDFLCQEINREINTIGSKTPQLEVSRAVVEMKNALENVREQLRNVE
ncbi:hypothetical protein AGMMS49928_05740 [Spirochaetia bacterium]|nr:hypothetical protein AGMMS49928_05740 [Spirochaetia bacterium]